MQLGGGGWTPSCAAHSLRSKKDFFSSGANPHPPKMFYPKRGGGEGGLAQGLGITLFAFGSAYWPLATAHSGGGGGIGHPPTQNFRNTPHTPPHCRAGRTLRKALVPSIKA